MSDAAVVEFVVGVGFRPLSNLSSTHIGEFWTTIKHEFPQVSDSGATPPPDVQLHAGTSDGFSIRSGGGAEVRQRFFSEDGSHILQIQNGWMFVNWVKRNEKASYPGYSSLIGKLADYLEKFDEYCKVSGLGEISAQMCELQYVNEMSQNSLIASKFLVEGDEIHTPTVAKVSGFSASLAFNSPGFPGVLSANPRQLQRRGSNEHVVVCEVKAVSGALGEKIPQIRGTMTEFGLGSIQRTSPHAVFI